MFQPVNQRNQVNTPATSSSTKHCNYCCHYVEPSILTRMPNPAA